MARLLRPVMKIISVIPAATASSTAYWINGLSTMGSISLGCALVAGKKRLPRPATGNTAFLIRLVIAVPNKIDVFRIHLRALSPTMARLAAHALFSCRDVCSILRTAVYQRHQRIFVEDGNAKLFRFCELAACFRARDNVTGFL